MPVPWTISRTPSTRWAVCTTGLLPCTPITRESPPGLITCADPSARLNTPSAVVRPDPPCPIRRPRDTDVTSSGRAASGAAGVSTAWRGRVACRSSLLNPRPMSRRRRRNPLGRGQQARR